MESFMLLILKKLFSFTLDLLNLNLNQGFVNIVY